MRRHFVLVLAILFFNAGPRLYGQQFVDGHYYASHYGSSSILQYDTAGGIVDSIQVQLLSGDQMRGLAFGPDQLLYIVIANNTGTDVIAINPAGQILSRYTSLGESRSNKSFGKIDFGLNQKFYVATQTGLFEFALGQTNSAKLIYVGELFDVRVLPGGNLLVANNTAVLELLPNGDLVRKIALSDPAGIVPGIKPRFAAVRGIEYDPFSDTLFAMQLGHDGFIFQLMKVDATSGALIDTTFFWLGDDLTLSSDCKLVVGSGAQTPAIYSCDLKNLGAFVAVDDRMFVTQFEIGPILIVPEQMKLKDGVQNSGALKDLWNSDDQRLHLLPSPTANLTKQTVELILQATSVADSPTSIDFHFESRMNGGPAGDVLQSISLFDYQLGRFEKLNSQAVSNSDATIELSITINPDRFVDPKTQEVTAMIRWKSESFSGAPFPWSVDIDQAVWRFQ